MLDHSHKNKGSVNFVKGSFIFFVALLFLNVNEANAQKEIWVCPICHLDYPTESEACACYKRHGYSCNGSLNNPINSGPTKDQVEAERKAKEEAERKEKEEVERKKREIEEKKRAEEARKKAEEEKRKKDNDAAVKRLGAKTSKDLGYVTDRNTPGFGFGKTELQTDIKNIKPGKADRDLSTAWRSLSCATDILGSMGWRFDKINTGSFSKSDLEEVKYLGSEMINALNGTKKGVQCNENSLGDPPSQLIIVEKKKQFYTKLAQGLTKQSETYFKRFEEKKSLIKKVDDEKNKIETLQTEITNLKNQIPKIPPATKQKFDKKVDDERIKIIGQVQKINEEIKHKEDLGALARASLKKAQDDVKKAENASNAAANNIKTLTGLEKKVKDPNIDMNSIENITNAIDSDGNYKPSKN